MQANVCKYNGEGKSHRLSNSVTRYHHHLHNLSLSLSHSVPLLHLSTSHSPHLRSHLSHAPNQTADPTRPLTSHPSPCKVMSFRLTLTHTYLFFFSLSLPFPSYRSFPSMHCSSVTWIACFFFPFPLALSSGSCYECYHQTEAPAPG